MDETLRASDQDREKVTRILHENYAQGRLDHDELMQRTHAALTAKNLGDLRALVRDLPPERAADPPPAAARRRPPSMLTWLGVTAAVAAMIAAVLISAGVFDIISHGIRGGANVVHDVVKVLHHVAHIRPRRPHRP